MNVAGIVLCGGRSSRMGRPKAWLPFAGELMLPRERLQEMIEAYYRARRWDQDGFVPRAVVDTLSLANALTELE